MIDLMTPRRRELVGRMAALGPTIAARADQVDRDAAFPYENYADLREAGFLALCIPKEHGGLGADFSTYALISEELARPLRVDRADLQHAHGHYVADRPDRRRPFDG